jgi:hypothetical protein
MWVTVLLHLFLTHKLAMNLAFLHFHSSPRPVVALIRIVLLFYDDLNKGHKGIERLPVIVHLQGQ